MTPFEIWCRAVEARHDPKHVGAIALSNLRYDGGNARVPHATRAAFRQRVEELHAADPSVPPELLIQTVAREKPDEYFCQGPEIDAEACSRIVPAQDFVHENIDLEEAGGWLIDDFVPDEHLDRLEAGLEGLAIKTIPRDENRRFAWVTRTSEVRQLRNHPPPEGVATAIRNRCGLLHHCGPLPVQYVEVQYPDGDFGAELHAPTFLEGSPYHVYVSKAQESRWGTALDVSAIHDGMSEAVHERIPFTARFKMKRLGYAAGELEVETTHVLANMPMPWNGNYTELEEMF